MALTDEGSMIWESAGSACSSKTPTVTGCTWKLATLNEWKAMVGAVGGYGALRDGGHKRHRTATLPFQGGLAMRVALFLVL